MRAQAYFQDVLVSRRGAVRGPPALLPRAVRLSAALLRALRPSLLLLLRFCVPTLAVYGGSCRPRDTARRAGFCQVALPL
ncbi:hypothetical protein GCM10022261_10250 [Brevibacterium daeguense]|uniref:Uncharacterized protein n=1 Tax=Brevibacterium daeguense TaxID=909936 RepID=A0ABP8EHQ1_9MICO